MAETTSTNFWDRVRDDHRLANARKRLSLHELRLLLQHAKTSISDVPMAEHGIVYVTVTGLTGTGKSAVMGEIEIALRSIGVAVEHDAEFQSEKNMTYADWQTALELYKPTVRLKGINIPRIPKSEGQ